MSGNTWGAGSWTPSTVQRISDGGFEASLWAEILIDLLPYDHNSIILAVLSFLTQKNYLQKNLYVEQESSMVAPICPVSGPSICTRSPETAKHIIVIMIIMIIRIIMTSKSYFWMKCPLPPTRTVTLEKENWMMIIIAIFQSILSLHTCRTVLFDVLKISGVTKMCSFFSSFSWRLRSINSKKEQLFPSLENDGRICRRNNQLIDVLASEHQHKMSDCALLFLRATRKGRKCLSIYCLQQVLADSNF